MSPTELGLVQSIYTLGGLVGALLAGPSATKYGRLFTMRATTIVFIFGPLAEALAPHVGVMIVGRFLSGIGAGASTVVCPIYISEVAPVSKRGFFGAFTQVMTNVGILMAQLLGYFLSRDSLWRIILGAAGILGAIEFLGLLITPETPKWLSEHRQANRARRILQLIRGSHINIDEEVKEWNHPPEHDEEESLLGPRASEATPRKPHVGIIQVVKSPETRTAVIGVVAVMVAQQLTGINSIIMYSVNILETVLPTSAALLTVIVSAVNVFVTLACSPLADKIGRKWCLLLSISGMGCGSVLLAIALNSNIRILAGISTLLFVASFAVGLGPVPFILASELVGPEAVGATQSWALAANWIATFIVAQFFPILKDAMGGRGRVYWVFAALALILGSFIAWWVPETKGKANADEVWGRNQHRRVD
ncbi:putative mfs glucose [Phaeomoniella chlamydospora]|uniref:Putative mfs glucose n=1 Tax=Phaeomoniella chlamydospora TaxID=158046 RepID=A0A0G2GVS9_PHACM|nr:putative mfs glucose [Phaeomoniella chlamydospora]